MSDPTPYREPKFHTTPRWVKVSMIIVTVLILAFAALLFTGVGGEHGPGRHMGRGGAVTTPRPAGTETDDGAPTPDVREPDDSPNRNADATEPEGHTPPPGMDHR